MISVSDMLHLERIRNLREDKDLTQTDIAKILNCSQRVYSDYECGKVAISVENLMVLANYYDVSLDYLTDRTNKKEMNK